MGKIIMVASGKGGVGKSTLAANIGASLAKKNKKTLIIDMDFGLTNLDIILNMPNFVYNIGDCISKRCTIDEIIYQYMPNLFFVAGQTDCVYKNISTEVLCNIILELSSRFDYVLLDAPAGISDGFLICSSLCNMALLVATPDPCSVRDCQKAAAIIRANGINNVRLIVNKVHSKKVKEKFNYNLDEMIDLCGIQLIGAVVESDIFIKAQSVGRIAVLYKPRSIVSKLISDISLRIMGKDVLFDRFW